MEISRDEGRTRPKKQNCAYGNSGDGLSIMSETDTEDEIGGIGRPRPQRTC